MENEEERLLLTDLCGGKGLVLAQKFGAQLHVAWLVHTVHVAEGSGDREVWSDRGEGLVHLVDL